MANLQYIAQGRGHLSQNLLGSNKSITLDFFNSSYNSVKVYPSVLYIANSANDGDIKLVFFDGTIRIVPAKTNYHIAIDSVRSMTLINQGHYDVYTYTLDKAAASETDITFVAATSAAQNDFIYHFDSVPDLTINYGTEPGNFGSATNSGATLNTNGKFGAGCLEFAPGASTWDVTDKGFFTVGANYVIDFWLRIATVSAVAATSIILIRDNPFTTNLFGLSFSAVGASKSIVAAGMTGTVTGAAIFTASASLWHFVRIIISASRVAIYINGAKYIDAAILPGFLASVSDRILLGNLIAGYSLMFDELRIARGLVLDNPETVPTQPYY